MAVFYKRPLCCVTVSYLACLILSARIFSSDVSVLLALLVTATVAAVLSRLLPLPVKIKKTLPFYFFGAILAFSIGILFFYFPCDKAEKLDGTACDIEATVYEVTSSAENYTTFLMNINKIDGTEVAVKASASIWSSESVSVGDTLRARTQFQRTQSSIGTFDTKNYLASKGVFACCELDNVVIIDSRENFSFFSRIADKIERNVYSKLSESSASLLSALLLGRSSNLPYEISVGFRRLGISHLLAISGMHFTLLLGVVSFLIRKICKSVRRQMIVVSLFSFFYMALIGFPASVCRAGIMVLASSAGVLFFSKRDGITSLFGAMLLLCIISPYAIFDIGLWLSFFATLSLLIIAYYKNRRNVARYYLYGGTRVVGYLRKESKKSTALYFVFVPILAAMSTLPLSSVYFGESSLLAAPATLILSPIFDVMLVIALLLGIGILPLAPLAETLCSCVISVINFFAKFDGITVSLTTPYATVACAILFIGVIIATFVKFRRRALRLITIIFVSAFCVIMIFGECVIKKSYESDAYIYYVCSGTNEAVAVSYGGETLVIDMSNGSYACCERLMYELRQRGATKLGSILLTRCNQRHATLIMRLARERMVDKIYFFDAEKETELNAMLHIREIAEKFDIECIRLGENELPDINGCELTDFEKIYGERSSLPTVCFEIKALGGSFAYLGSGFADIGIEFPQCDVVICGTHGPKPTRTFEVSGNVFVAGNVSDKVTGQYFALNDFFEFQLGEALKVR